MAYSVQTDPLPSAESGRFQPVNIPLGGKQKRLNTVWARRQGTLGYSVKKALQGASL